MVLISSNNSWSNRMFASNIGIVGDFGALPLALSHAKGYSMHPQLPLSRLRIALQPPGLRWALALSLGLALLYWLIALYIRNFNIIPVWYDQAVNFSSGMVQHFFDPYAIPGFVNVPWLTLILLPFGWLPLPLSTLIQICLLFGLLTLLIFKYGGNFRTVAITLLSFMALDAALEINIDWVIVLALLLPVLWSGPLLLIKPQNALGVVISYRRREFLGTVVVCTGAVALSLAVWGLWPIRMWEAIQKYTLGRTYNLAPIVILSLPVSLTIGVMLGYVAWLRRDPALSILAWIFFVPYIPFYGLLLAFAMFAIRAPRIALIANVAMWIIYGGAIAIGLLSR